MSQMTFSVLDIERPIHARRHASFVDVLIPALSDDPETIEELQHAMRRFLPPDRETEPQADWSAGDFDEPTDAGLCLVDMAARLIVYQSTYSEFLRCGRVTFDEGDDESARWIAYHLADEWLITDQLDKWRSLSGERRRERAVNAPFDTRVVLFGKVVEFIVDECLAARGGATDADGAWTPPVGWQWRELPERAADGKPVRVYDVLAEIHARWLMTPREDLRGQSPRDVLQAKRTDLDWQLQDREFQWSTFRERPQLLWRESVAYRCCGYGTHEIVVYYYLLRHLLDECWDQLVAPPEHDRPTRAEAIERLGAAQQEWLHTPKEEVYHGKAPAYVIECERLRIPLGISGHEAMIDHDCPLCQMMADSGPFFWHLDGCNMDDDFPFELFRGTRQEWEEEQRRRAEWDAEWEREQQACDDDEDDEELPWVHDEPVVTSSPVWQRSFAYQGASDSPAMTLFGLGAHLAELIVDLRESDNAAESRNQIDTLNRDFGNLREAVADPASSLAEPVASKFREHLLALSETHPALTATCLDLDRQFNDFARRLSGEPDLEDDVPF